MLYHHLFPPGRKISIYSSYTGCVSQNENHANFKIPKELFWLVHPVPEVIKLCFSFSTSLMLVQDVATVRGERYHPWRGAVHVSPSSSSSILSLIPSSSQFWSRLCFLMLGWSIFLVCRVITVAEPYASYLLQIFSYFSLPDFIEQFLDNYPYING